MSKAGAAAPIGQGWQLRPRARVGLEAVPMQAKPNLKTMEAELQHQSLTCYDRIQQDLDLLHNQVHAEIHQAVSQELAGVSYQIQSLNAEAFKDVDMLRTTVNQLCEEAKWMRKVREQDAREAQEAAIKAAKDVFHQLTAALKTEAAGFRSELEVFAERLADAESRRLQDVERLDDFRAASETGLESRVEAHEQRIEEILQRLSQQEEADAIEHGRLGGSLETVENEAKASLSQLQEAFRGEAAVGEARFREAQAAVAALELRQIDALEKAVAYVVGRTDTIGETHQKSAQVLEDRLASTAKQLKERLEATTEEIRHISSECREGISIAQSSWTRSVDWSPEVDINRLDAEGKLDIGSPLFSSAGLRALQLRLRVTYQANRPGEDNFEGVKSRRFVVGAFLRSPLGQVNFKLHVANKNQSFTADFSQSPEWGSQRICVLDALPNQLTVRLEVLEAETPADMEHWPPGFAASVRIADAAQVAAREVTALRSSMVRRIEWRVARVSERVAAAKHAASSMIDDEAMEPIVSPAFAAGGIEGLQLQLYPIGYRSRGEESCGFFLTCPRGTYVKCKAFVGDAVRTFEHQYDVKEPFGRGSFCRLLDKAEGDDCIVCGIELLEIRQEATLQVRGGPFGTVADQLKVVSNPSVGGMEAVRELREQVKARPRPRQSYATSERRAATPTPAATFAAFPALAGVKSLPLLFPTAGISANATALPGVFSSGPGYPSSPGKKQVDAQQWR